jgi:hypothetical protein
MPARVSPVTTALREYIAAHPGAPRDVVVTAVAAQHPEVKQETVSRLYRRVTTEPADKPAAAPAAAPAPASGKPSRKVVKIDGYDDKPPRAEPRREGTPAGGEGAAEVREPGEPGPGPDGGSADPAPAGDGGDVSTRVPVVARTRSKPAGKQKRRGAAPYGHLFGW